MVSARARRAFASAVLMASFAVTVATDSDTLERIRPTVETVATDGVIAVVLGLVAALIARRWGWRKGFYVAAGVGLIGGVGLLIPPLVIFGVPALVLAGVVWPQPVRVADGRQP